MDSPLQDVIKQTTILMLQHYGWLKVIPWQKYIRKFELNIKSAPKLASTPPLAIEVPNQIVIVLVSLLKFGGRGLHKPIV